MRKVVDADQLYKKWQIWACMIYLFITFGDISDGTFLHQHFKQMHLTKCGIHTHTQNNTIYTMSTFK